MSRVQVFSFQRGSSPQVRGKRAFSVGSNKHDGLAGRLFTLQHKRGHTVLFDVFFVVQPNGVIVHFSDKAGSHPHTGYTGDGIRRRTATYPLKRHTNQTLLESEERCLIDELHATLGQTKLVEQVFRCQLNKDIRQGVAHSQYLVHSQFFQQRYCNIR